MYCLWRILASVHCRSFGFLRQLSCLQYILSSWIKEINHSQLLFIKSRAKFSATAMESSNFSMDLPLYSQRGACIRTWVRNACLAWWSAQKFFLASTVSFILLDVVFITKIYLSSIKTSNNLCICCPFLLGIHEIHERVKKY